MRVMIKVFFSAEEGDRAPQDGKKAKVTAYTLNAFQTYIKEFAQKYYGVKLKFKGTLTEPQKEEILKAIDALPEVIKIEVVFKKAHKFAFDPEANKAFIAELNKRTRL